MLCLSSCYSTITCCEHATLNMRWQDRISNKELYVDLLPISTTLQIRRLQFSGHCWRSKNEVISQLRLWDLNHGRRSRGRPATAFIEQLKRNTGIHVRNPQLSWQKEGSGEISLYRCGCARSSSSRIDNFQPCELSFSKNYLFFFLFFTKTTAIFF